MAPVRSYTNWNSRTTDEEEQIEPYRKYFFICEGANTETWYFKKLIDSRKSVCGKCSKGHQEFSPRKI